MRFQLILVGLLGAVSISVASTAQFSYGNCEAQGSEKEGVCIHIRDCPYLYEILNIKKTTPEQRQLLADSQCGIDNTRQSSLVQRILVCCPKSKRNQGTNATSGGTTNSNAKSGDDPEPGNVLPSIGNCGIQFGDRIYGGRRTKIFEFPWMALLKYKRKDSNEFGFSCAGALINSRYVLTAGHCLESNKLEGWDLHSVRLGEWDTSTAPDCETEITKKTTCAPMHLDLEVEKKIPHDLYVPNAIDQMHDIALVRLKTPVRFTDYVKPICLPVGDEVRNNHYEGYSMEVAGWGVTEANMPSNVKLKITVDVNNLDKCKEKYRTFQMNLNSSQLCAGGKEGIDSCKGDSGGPLMVLNDVGKQEIYFVAGVTSYGPTPCGTKGWPGVYTRVGYFVDWIIKNLEA